MRIFRFRHYPLWCYRLAAIPIRMGQRQQVWIAAGAQSPCQIRSIFANIRATETWLVRVLFITYLAVNSCIMLLTFGAIFMEYLHKGIPKKLQDIVLRPDADSAKQGTSKERARSDPKESARTCVPFRGVSPSNQIFVSRPACFLNLSLSDRRLMVSRLTSGS
jgi:hypothetical protein